MGPVLGPRARTDRTRDTRVAEPWLPAPEVGRSGGEQRLTPDAPHNGGRPTPRGRPPTTPRHAAPTGNAGQGDSVGPPHPHTGAHSTWVADPKSPPSGQAVGGETAPDLKRPSQWWKAPSPGTLFRHRHSEQRRPARAHAVGPVLGPHARNRPQPGHTGRGTLAARSRRRAPGGGTAPDTRRPSQRWQATPPGNSPPPPPRHAAPTGHAGQGDSVGPPHPITPAPTARGWWTPTARQVGGQSGEGQRLTSDAPHNGGSTPPGDALPPFPQRATPARKGARCGAGAGFPRQHRPHPGHTGCGTLAAGSRGRAAGGRTAPDTRRPSQRWQATPPGTAPHHPRGTQPPWGMQAKGTVLGPRTHTPAPTARGWRTPTARPVGGQLGEGQRLTSDAPHNGGRHPPPPMILAAVFSQNSKSCIFRTAISNCTQ